MSPGGGTNNGQNSLLTSEIFQLFSCCATLKSTNSSSQNLRGRKRIDISMISGPSDFRHTAHLGSNDIHSGSSSVYELQAQMASKGG